MKNVIVYKYFTEVLQDVYDEDILVNKKGDIILEKGLYLRNQLNNTNKTYLTYECPDYSVVFLWLRDKFDLLINQQWTDMKNCRLSIVCQGEVLFNKEVFIDEDDDINGFYNQLIMTAIKVLKENGYV